MKSSTLTQQFGWPEPSKFLSNSDCPKFWQKSIFNIGHWGHKQKRIPLLPKKIIVFWTVAMAIKIVIIISPRMGSRTTKASGAVFSRKLFNSEFETRFCWFGTREVQVRLDCLTLTKLVFFTPFLPNIALISVFGLTDVTARLLPRFLFFYLPGD